jgi:hypothetical protein
MRFSKITTSDKGVVLTWDAQDEARAIHTHKLESTDAPGPDLVAAIEAFRPIITDLLKTPERFIGEGCDIRGFSLSTTDDGQRGLVITLVKKLAKFKAPVTFNLPYLEEPTGEKRGPGFFPEGMSEAIEALETAAEAYVKGDRLQRELALAGDAAA